MSVINSGKSQKDMDLIGSVTGEVIEVNRVPVLAIPENVPFTDLRDAKNSRTPVKRISFHSSLLVEILNR